VTTVDSTSRFLAQIRTQVAAVARKAPRGNAAQGKTAATGSDSTPRDIDSLVLTRVLTIDPDDPKGRRKAFRIFLETVLSDELGSELLNDPAFYRIIDDIQATMEQDDTLLPAIERAGEFLLRSARGTAEK